VDVLFIVVILVMVVLFALFMLGMWNYLRDQKTDRREDNLVQQQHFMIMRNNSDMISRNTNAIELLTEKFDKFTTDVTDKLGELDNRVLHLHTLNGDPHP